MYCKIPLKEKYLHKVYLGRNLHIKAELLVIVSSGESGMGQGGTLSWRRGSLCPGWLQECPSVTILHASGPPAPQSLPTPLTESLWPGCRAGHQREALLCTGSYYGLCCRVLADTHSGLVTYRKTGDRLPPPACLPGSNLKQTQQPTGWVNPQTTVASAQGQILCSSL